MKDPGLRMSYFPDGYDRHLVTIFSVDLEEGGPVWHFSMASRNTNGIVLGDQGTMLRLDQWDFDPEDKYFDYASSACLPRPFDAEHDWSDRQTCSIHIRQKLTEAERKYVVSPEEGGMTMEQAGEIVLGEYEAKWGTIH